MWLAEFYYKKIKKTEVPYYARYSIFLIVLKPIRKFFIHNIIPNCPFNSLRISLYKAAGFKIGKKCFIGMKAYFDDMEPSLITIKDGVIISFETCFCVHGRYQKHTPIVIEDNAYIGCRATILSGKMELLLVRMSLLGHVHL